MSDDRLFDSFHMLDGPVDPDEAFTERLFQGLAADLGFRPVTRREAVVRRFAGAAPTFRLAYLAAMLGLLLAAAVVVALVGAQLLQARSVAEIVSASQAAQLNPPPYDMTIQADDGRIVRVRTDGQDVWRWDRKADGECPAIRTRSRPTGSWVPTSRRTTRGRFHRPAASCPTRHSSGGTSGPRTSTHCRGPSCSVARIGPTRGRYRRRATGVSPRMWCPRVLGGPGELPSRSDAYTLGPGVGRRLGTSYGAGAGAFVPTGHVRADRSSGRRNR